MFIFRAGYGTVETPCAIMKSTGSPVIYLLTLILVLTSCTGEEPLFRRLKAGRTGITFSNRLTESDKYNILDFEVANRVDIFISH